jgi:hypothetical protein
MDIDDTSGFYKVDDDGIFHHAPNFVRAPSYTLLVTEKDAYTYPVDGWIWFDNIKLAAEHFNIVLPENKENE